MQIFDSMDTFDLITNAAAWPPGSAATAKAKQQHASGLIVRQEALVIHGGLG